MAQYRKKPIVVEAEIYKVGMEDGMDHTYIPHRPYIKTLEGELYISEGDYIITGIKGERYPCKPGIFEATYEKVE